MYSTIIGLYPCDEQDSNAFFNRGGLVRNIVAPGRGLPDQITPDELEPIENQTFSDQFETDPGGGALATDPGDDGNGGETGDRAAKRRTRRRERNRTRRARKRGRAPLRRIRSKNKKSRQAIRSFREDGVTAAERRKIKRLRAGIRKRSARRDNAGGNERKRKRRRRRRGMSGFAGEGGMGFLSTIIDAVAGVANVVDGVKGGDFAPEQFIESGGLDARTSALLDARRELKLELLEEKSQLADERQARVLAARSEMLDRKIAARQAVGASRNVTSTIKTLAIGGAIIGGALLLKKK